MPTLIVSQTKGGRRRVHKGTVSVSADGRTLKFDVRFADGKRMLNRTAEVSGHELRTILGLAWKASRHGIVRR